MPSSYLVIESQDPFEFRDVEEGYRLVADLAARGAPVTLFLVQNGVLAARQGARAGQFAALATTPGVTVLVDTFALQERGIPPTTLVPGVRPADMDTLVDLLMADGQKAIWH
jgi:sulfur relay (sulfurtransferase) complex TusBCD TusD component (DsrE family)